MKDDLKNGKDKFVGKFKEVTGDIMDDEGLQLKGKLQSMKADISEKVGEMKEEVLSKANDLVDKVKDGKDNHKMK